MSAKPTILNDIYRIKRQRVEEAKRKFDPLAYDGQDFRNGVSGRDAFLSAFGDSNRANIIAEIKRASPSKGVINSNFDVTKMVRNYEAGGASAISVLTEVDNFLGSVSDLIAARRATSLPILRKDFIFDEFQIRESKAIGADAILLIAAMLDDKEIESLYNQALDLGLGVLVEVHNENEMKRAVTLGAEVIGINNRNLHTFEVSLEISKKLASSAPEGTILVSESGLNSKDDILELKDLGFRGFLIGEALMRSNNPVEALKDLVGG